MMASGRSGVQEQHSDRAIIEHLATVSETWEGAWRWQPAHATPPRGATQQRTPTSPMRHRRSTVSRETARNTSKDWPTWSPSTRSATRSTGSTRWTR
ncbi:hypothetical protein SBRY_60556 [Actinacidiphila bryophytorum]|uniref:Uncharacterized protein n=1 Tax=Actinacidiphila bryophytorum TaxID=1436133 RepID=A0A9W4H6S7_9ACTN|nr:hypothetical protein SBRY_60556 [Actinacidiphila bryophytorum]